MNQQARPNTYSEDTFESAIAQLLERIRKTTWARSQLFTIVVNGLEVTKETDAIFYHEGSFTKFRLYVLYKVAFEVWSYQHQAILESLEADKPQKLIENSPIVVQHQYVFIKMFDDLNHLASVTDPNSLRNGLLLVWRETIFELTKFLDIPMVLPVKSKRQNLFGFKLGRKLPDMSPKTKYVIFSTFLLLLGILIATLLLIRN